MRKEEGKKALEGIRVIDWTQFVAGPAASCWLGALGAAVIHVERSGVGDGERGANTISGVNCRLPGGRQTIIETWNYNKKSLTLDLSKVEGREIMFRLVKSADVFVTNFLPRVVEANQMDYETLSKLNPKLIWGTNTINGPKGPDMNVPGFDYTGQGRGGLMMTSGSYGEGPVPVTTGVADQSSALALTSGVMTALFVRERYGIGQKVETSQLQTVMNVLVSSYLSMYLLGRDQATQFAYGAEARQFEREANINPLTNYYRCSDDRWIMLSAPFEHSWPPFVKVIGRPDLEIDPRFSTPHKREENCREVISILDEIFAQKSLDEWSQKLREIRFPFSPINSLRQLPADEQVIANNYIISFDHPELGLIQLPGMPFTLSHTGAAIETCAPVCGQHTEEVLLDLGYSWEDIEKFRKESVI